MIQRIQTVYLLVVAILMVVMMSLPVGSFVASDYTATVFNNLSLVAPDGTADYESWAMFAILMVSAVVTLGTIFLYKKRMLQIRLTIFNIILLLGYYGTLVTFVFMLKGENSFTPSWTVILPLISIILDWLAIRAIGKDEMLVKAYERLR
ncbi:DUF4293 domain-containing protein [Phocaeicola barnesiae]|uniref:DUF4293 domain-containing protein n=1 Tax=Phocaeicola barnesiae TaxID=376804 RepID=UPI001D64151B|nr:DUF4293 domain-containing protein [Phocaeicola barnesiae]HJG77132.1 DUF4293 domain-containing protein [Phocaeicola barnesiae]